MLSFWLEGSHQNRTYKSISNQHSGVKTKIGNNNIVDYLVHIDVWSSISLKADSSKQIQQSQVTIWTNQSNIITYKQEGIPKTLLEHNWLH